MHLALKILGVGQGDEVICQSFTFCGSVNPVTYQGAVPVLVDSEPATWNLDPQLAEEAIKDRTRKGKKPAAIIYVHLYGMPAMVKEIKYLADKYKIPLIEDAAEALGSKYEGRRVGAFGDISIFSFNGNKIITTSGGGAMVSQTAEYIEKARFLSTQARDKQPHYEHSEIGYNYRLSNVLAGIGRGQLSGIEERVAKRRWIFEQYQTEFSGMEGIEFCSEPGFAFSNRWLTCILVDPGKTGGVDREAIRLALEKENIESRPFWKPMHLQPVYKNSPQYVNGISESLFNSGLCLPSGTAMTGEDIGRVVSVIRRCIGL
jgi:dTDP-4-amino-4,6-dideoxygalactose transaminase